MGFNSVAVIFNDCHGQLADDDGRISRKIANAMREYTWRDRDRMAPYFGVGAIVSQAHADYSQVVVVGQNRGRPLNDCDDLDGYALTQLVAALVRHGYQVKAPVKKRKKAITSSQGGD